MTIHANSLEAYHRAQSQATDRVVFPSMLTFVWTSFVLSLLQTGLNTVFLLSVAISATLYCIDLWQSGWSGFTLSLLPFAIWTDFLFTFLILLLFSTEDRIAQHTNLTSTSPSGPPTPSPSPYVSFALSLSKPAYFRLRAVALYRLCTTSSYYRYRYHHWYTRGHLRHLSLLDAASAFIIYLPAYQGASMLAAKEGGKGTLGLTMWGVAVICTAAFLAAQFTWMHQLVEAVVVWWRRKTEEGEEGKGSGSDGGVYIALSEGDEDAAADGGLFIPGPPAAPNGYDSESEYRRDEFKHAQHQHHSFSSKRNDRDGDAFEDKADFSPNSPFAVQRRPVI